MLIDDIKPHLSVGDLVLGATEQDVTRALGQCSSRQVNEWGDVELEYEHLGVRCVFWDDFDLRLGYIGTERRTATVAGHELFGKTKAEIERFISDVLESAVSTSDGCVHEDGSVQEWVDVDSHGLSFWFDNDSLYLTDVFCDWLDADTPDWPK